MRARLKSLVPERGRLLIRHIGRLRWLTKWRNLHRPEGRGWQGRPLKQLRHVLIDAEVDSYTYDVVNRDELAEALAGTLDLPVATIAGYMDEALDDPELPRDVGWRVLFLRRDARPTGHYLAAYAAIRALRPAMAVETGILDGMGSRTMLRALHRNGAGRLWSFDIMPGAGAYVPARLRDSWTPVYDSTRTALEPVLAEREVGLFLHDSLADAAHQEFELRAALARAAPGAVIMTGIGWTGVLQRIAAEMGVPCPTVHERPRDHFYQGRRISWVRAPSAG